MITTIFKTII